FEVFSVTDELNDHTLLNVYTVGETRETIRAKNGLQVVPDYGIKNCPGPDYLVIPGGSGTRALLKTPAVLDWVTQTAVQCTHVLSVCSGSLVLAKTGLLKGLKACTHHEVLDELADLAQDTEICRDKRFADNGKILTSAGVAAGMDLSLYMVGKLFGQDQALKTANYIEYSYTLK
ncbi:MAG: DJ-1/PfpI family protein, partial [Desulfobacteraceae bacterium]|nr:DJ-1/PfpI family protein [Desulfobacteraceae bacterium]